VQTFFGKTLNPLLLVHIRFDQARIDRKPIASNQPSCDAHRNNTLKHTAQGIALEGRFPNWPPLDAGGRSR
jgi:hypothetical protein